MKKIITILFLFLTVISYGQIDSLDIVKLLNAGNGRRQGSELIKVNTAMRNVQTGVFNILNYGATNGGVVEDQTAIQAAINAAYNYGDGTTWGGTVIIPDGDWYITSCDTLKSYIDIKIGKNARFLFPSGYTGCMWYFNNATVRLEKCNINGGYYYGPTTTWDFMRLSSTVSTGIVFNSFSNFYIHNCNIAFNLTAVNPGWINANIFEKFVIDKPIEFVKPRGNTIMGNIFDNINVQTETTTTFLIDSLGGEYNKFTNIIAWDFAGTASQHLCILTSTAYYNTIEIQNAGATTAYHDLGAFNSISINSVVHSWRLETGDREGNDATYRGNIIINQSGATLTEDGGLEIKNDQGGSGYGYRILGALNSGQYDLHFQNRINSAAWTSQMVIAGAGAVNTTGAINYVLDNSVGGNDTYTATISSFVFTVGKVITFHPLTANTDGCTLNINGGGAVAIETQAAGALATNDILSTGYYSLCWDGANWVLIK